jgi:hypothetical protein
MGAKATGAITDNSDLSRYELPVDGGTAFVIYRLAPGVITLLHAEVPAALEGRGVGSELVRATLDAVRARGLKVIPRCSFVAAYMRRHTEAQDLLV